jgi:hypothetical protein
MVVWWVLTNEVIFLIFGYLEKDVSAVNVMMIIQDH